MRALLLAVLGACLCACTVDPASNPNRCGTGDTCPAGRRCHRPAALGQSEPGFCVEVVVPDAGCVPSGPERCNGVDDDCDGSIDEDFNLRSAETCGACDVRCEEPNPNCVLEAGVYRCGRECTLSWCASVCVDTQTEEDNCGACGVRCDASEDCIDGGCSCDGVGPDCAGNATSTCCGAQCVDINTSNNHCGGCNIQCASGASCVAQQCRCGSNTDCRADRLCVAGICRI